MDLADRHPDRSAVVIGHGGITVDLARNHLGDDGVETMASGVMVDGIPHCAITEIIEDSGSLVFARLAGTDSREIR